MKVIIAFCLFVCLSAKAQYLLDSGKVGYIHHVKSYECKLSLRKEYEGSLYYKGYIYSMDSNEVIFCDIKPKYIRPNNINEVKFSKFFIENIDKIALRNVNYHRPALYTALGLGIVPGILIASSDQSYNGNPKSMYSGLKVFAGIAYTIISTPIYLTISFGIASQYKNYRIRGLKENYFKHYERLHYKTYGF